jgi:hypothetical protein
MQKIIGVLFVVFVFLNYISFVEAGCGTYSCNDGDCVCVDNIEDCGGGVVCTSGFYCCANRCCGIGTEVIITHNTCKGIVLPNCPAGTHPGDPVISVTCGWTEKVCAYGSQFSLGADCNCRENCTGYNYNSTRECNPVCDRVVTQHTCVPNCNANAWSDWSPLCGSQTQTRTNNCGTVETRATPNYIECEGLIRGTIFDASDLSACPSFDPVTGYLVGVDTTLTANNRTFTMTDQSNVSPHPWSLLSPALTNSVGNYSVRVYAPTTYNYNFNSLSDIYITSTGPKLTCTSASAVVPSNNIPGCTTQPCTLVKNMSFGFNRYWSGWWQAQGASVHAEDGLKSSIPSDYPGEQSLILKDPAIGNRTGVLSYGLFSDTMLGLNTNAKVSTNLWQVESKYTGIIYDHDYFKQQFKKYTTTVWDGVSPIVYDDKGLGYQIFKVSGPVTFSYVPTGTEKTIFLIDGNVTINTNLVVPVGAYLSIISNGDISFGTAVTRVDGWYVAKNILVPCIDANSDTQCDRTDVQFQGNGSFVAWRGMTLKRDRGAVANIAGPAEKFTYRLDLYNNAPDPMKNVTKIYRPYVP